MTAHKFNGEKEARLPNKGFYDEKGVRLWTRRKPHCEKKALFKKALLWEEGSIIKKLWAGSSIMNK